MSGRCNAYLIVKDKNIILVYTGKKSAFESLSKKMESLNIKVDDNKYLILTHTHFDHCLSAKLIKQKSNCKIIVSELDADFIKHGYTSLPDGTNLLTKLISRLGCFIGKGKFGYEPFQSDIMVENELELNISDIRIKITETAGHSSDSISIIVNNEIAIAGDAMFGVFRHSVFPPFADDTEKMIESWGELLKTDCTVFFPGHGNEIKR